MHRPNSSTGIRIPFGHKGVPLHELQQSLLELDNAIIQRKRTLRELWRRAAVADRALAVQRMLREGGIPGDVADVLVSLMDNMQAAFRAVRTARTQGQSVAIAGAEVDLQLATRALDEFMEEANVFEKLFEVSESYLIDVPYERGIRPLPSMFGQRELLLHQIQRIATRRRRRGPIRMLSPLTMSGSIPIIK